MKKQMQKIIQQQQEYEYLKKCPTLLRLPNNLFVSSLTAATVFPYIQKASQRRNRQKLQNQIAKWIFNLFLFYYILCFAFSFYYLLLYPLTLIE